MFPFVIAKVDKRRIQDFGYFNFNSLKNVL